MQSRTDSFASFACQTADNYDKSENNQINARALIGQSAVGAGKPMEKSRVFWIIIWKQ